MARMDVREKLVNVVKRASYLCLPSNTQDFHINMFVTDLIAHGVTVQEWISVKDMLPEENEIILAWVAACRDLHFCFGSEVSGLEVTHWMPLPEPPEEGTV